MSDGKLENHTDWVRDVAWAPSIGLPVSRIASCSQDGRVIVWRKDDTEGGTWTPQASGMAAVTQVAFACPFVCDGMWGGGEGSRRPFPEWLGHLAQSLAAQNKVRKCLVTIMILSFCEAFTASPSPTRGKLFSVYLNFSKLCRTGVWLREEHV